MRGNDRAKAAALEKVAGGRTTRLAGRSTHQIGSYRVHARFCSPPTYKFNINPNTLRADYELWVCGSEALYYLIPIGVIRTMYEHPQAYTDYQHPEIRVVSVLVDSNEAMYAAGGVKENIAKFRNVVLP